MDCVEGVKLNLEVRMAALASGGKGTADCLGWLGREGRGDVGKGGRIDERRDSWSVENGLDSSETIKLYKQMIRILLEFVIETKILKFIILDKEDEFEMSNSFSNLSFSTLMFFLLQRIISEKTTSFLKSCIFSITEFVVWLFAESEFA